MTTSETSFPFFWYIIAESKEAYAHLSRYIKNGGKRILKPVKFSVFDSFIDLKYNELFFDGTSNNISKDMAIYCLKALFRPLISQLCEEKGRIESQGRYL